MVDKLGSKIFIQEFEGPSEKKELFWWWNPKVGSGSADFCTDSSLHGLKYLGQRDRHISERILWGFIVFSSVVASAYFISTVFDNYQRNPVIVAFNSHETAIETVPFPAITVCNINNIRKSRAEEYFREAKGPINLTKTREAQRKLYYLDHVCSSSPAYSRKFNYSLDKTEVDPKLLKAVNLSKHDESQGDISTFFEEASQSCSDLIRHCLWRDVVYPCEKLFQGMETDYGFCCVFNMVPQSLLHRFRNDPRDSMENIHAWEQWDVDKNGIFLQSIRSDPNALPRRQKLAGKSSGLSILLDPDIQEYFCTNTDSVGFKMGIHLPIEVPNIVDKAVAIPPNSELFVDIRPEITMAHRNILGFPLDKRNCYDQKEFPLHYYKFYTAANCISECIANKTFERCNCVRYYMPRDDTRGLCPNEKHECTEDVERRFFQKGAERACKFCLPNCQEIHYYSETTFLPIQNAFNIWENKSGKPKWFNKNVSIVHIFFGSGRTYSRLRTELYGTVALIANTGGLLGLCLGFSGISLIEIIYFLTLRAYCAAKRRNRNGNGIKLNKDFHQTKNNWAKHSIQDGRVTSLKSFYGSNSNNEIIFFPNGEPELWPPNEKNSSISKIGQQKHEHIILDVNSFLQ